MKVTSYIVLALSLVAAKGIVAYPIKFKNKTGATITMEVFLTACSTITFTLSPGELKSLDTGICCTTHIDMKIDGNLVGTIKPQPLIFGMACRGYEYTIMIDQDVRIKLLEKDPYLQERFGKVPVGLSVVEGIR